MEKQSVDQLYRSELTGGHIIPPEELWLELEQKLKRNTAPKNNKLWLLSIPIAASLLLMVNLYANREMPLVNQPVFSQVNRVVLIQNNQMELLQASPSFYSVNKVEMKDEIASFSEDEIIASSDEFQIDDAIIQANAISLLNEIELELNNQVTDNTVEEPVRMLRINPELLLEDVDQESRGNKFAKTVFSKIKGGFKEIETRVASRKEK